MADDLENLDISDLGHSDQGGHVMPSGEHQGKTFDQIASTKEGLLYLDWLVGQDWLRDPLKSALRDYLSNANIQRDIETAMEQKPYRLSQRRDPEPKRWWE
jgi:hypothetical protein